MIRKVLYFFFSLVLSFLLSGNESFIPDPPSISSSNYILIDANTNRVLAEMNPDEEIEPAS
ncbi:MAG TPA: serine-type D-Ala-D-Ala carboxypeptidase, partial [Gammaproteobacteria bacterium]|nr:serine-type D-Ala-D-Ala carboxypeptidase [Gammaproteobacteria bacterium]